MELPLSLYAETILPTIWGDFRCLVFRDLQNVEHVALIKGELTQSMPVLCRIHSECLTGEVFGSVKCDCKQQFDNAMKAISDAGCGVVLYLRQEGRGIGLGNKIRAYALQKDGLDTVDANRVLGFHDDSRNYDVAIEMLKQLGVTSIELMTNNPAKLEAIKNSGLSVTRRAQWVVPISNEAKKYLAVKKERMGHL